MQTDSKQQSVSSLRFFLFDRPLHPELFRVYHDHHITTGAYEARIWVTGCSHVISFHREEAVLTQVIAEADSLLPNKGRLLELPLRGERDHHHNHTEQINYMMNFQLESMSRNVYSKTHHDLANQGVHSGIFVPLSDWRTQDNLTPFTFIDFQAKPKELHLFTYHAFPEELKMVRTQSIFEAG